MTRGLQTSQAVTLTNWVCVKSGVYYYCVCLHSFPEVKTGLKISPQVSLSQLTSSCVLSLLSQRHLLSASHVHTNSKSEVRKGSPLLTWSPGWRGRSCRQGHRSSWGVSCGSWLHRGCFRCCCCGRYAANKIYIYLLIFLFQEAAKWAFAYFVIFQRWLDSYQERSTCCTWVFCKIKTKMQSLVSDRGWIIQIIQMTLILFDLNLLSFSPSS